MQREPKNRTVDRALEAIEGLPRLGWVATATPVEPLDALGAACGMAWLGCKRDDLGESLCGGSKPRKLDYLLASEPFRDAASWASVGAIGSGHLVACTAAAQKLGRRFEAHIFWEPLSSGVLENLSFTLSGPTLPRGYSSRLSLALQRPRVLLARWDGDVPVIPPGATHPVAMLGLVRAALELAVQVRAGMLPEPDRLVVALGSGGTAAGLAVGLGIAGLRTRVHAVATVEWPLVTQRRVQGLMRALRRCLAQQGLAQLAAAEPALITVDHGFIGAGYGHPSAQALAAVQEADAAGLRLEPVYTGKAFAALLAAARLGQCKSERVLFWNTVRRAGPLPCDPQWRERVPEALRRRLAKAEASEITALPGLTRWTRRRLLLAGAVLTAAGLTTQRLSGYRLPDWKGKVLSPAQALIVMAAAEALLPPVPRLARPAPLPPDYHAVAVGVDTYLSGLPTASRREIGALLAVLEHGTTPLGGHWQRLTRLDVAERRAFLERLRSRGGLLAQAAVGIRDLVMLGYYQRPESWAPLGYPGPQVAALPRPRRAAYAMWVAGQGSEPGPWPARKR